MKKLMLVLALMFVPVFAQAQVTQNPYPIYQGYDSGYISTRSVYGFMIISQTAPDIGNPQLWFQIHDTNFPLNGGEPANSETTWPITYRSPLIQIFPEDTPLTINDGLRYCISDSPTTCSPAGSGPYVVGTVIGD